MSPNVKIVSACFIKPKSISKETKKPIYLSPWDLAMMSTHYIQKGLLYRLPENQDFSITTFLNDLKDSLSATLTHFHPLAARLATIKQTKPPSFVVFINPENSPGAKFIHSAVNLMVADIITPTDVPLIVKSFFDLNGAISHDGHKLPLLSVQVTELIDGIFIGCSVNHMVVDGSSYWHFFNSWSEVFNSKRRNDSLLVCISRPPVLQRWVPTGSDPIHKLPFTHEDQFIDRPNPKFLRERIFHFSSDTLSKLKAKVNSECDTTKISTLQSLAAVVWRCVTRARSLKPETQTACRMAADNRKRISPPLSETYFAVVAFRCAMTEIETPPITPRGVFRQHWGSSIAVILAEALTTLILGQIDRSRKLVNQLFQGKTGQETLPCHENSLALTRSRVLAREERHCHVFENPFKTCFKPRTSRSLCSPLTSNSLHSVKAIATAGALLDHSIGWAAWRLHKEVVNHDDKVIKEFVGSWLKGPFAYTSRFFDPCCIQIGGSPRFDMYGNKFGLGKALAVRSGYANKFDGKVTVYPGNEGGGSMDLEISLLPENMEAFESDEEFMSVVAG